MHRRRTHSTFLLFFILTNKRYYKSRLSGFIWNFLSMEMKNIHSRIKILFCFASWNEINYNAYTTQHIYGIIRKKTDMTGYDSWTGFKPTPQFCRNWTLTTTAIRNPCWLKYFITLRFPFYFFIHAHISPTVRIKKILHECIQSGYFAFPNSFLEHLICSTK